MPAGGLVPEQAVAFLAAITVFSVMLVVGLALDAREFRWVFRHPGLIASNLFGVLVAVPALALAVCRSVELPREVEIGIVLMAISPGAPVALRRSLGAGMLARRAFPARTAVAISGAMRNPGLALVVATRNAAQPETIATIFAYLVVSAVIVLTYVAWRRSAGDAHAEPS